MSYLVLARKYRPQNFEEMVGQEHVVKALSNALSQQRLHHAYLFTGTRGVGKTTVSRILAKSLNCQGADGQGGITAHPCGVCQSCRDIDAGRFVDYTELDAASNRGVEEVQSLMEQAVYKPVQGRFKVFMIDEVHMLSNTAFNAMLKTLEEPPPYLKFVLATTDPQKVPVTVLSRCLQFNLRPMAPQTIAEHLEHVLGREYIEYDRSSLQLLARGARGSMRDALSLTDQAIAYGNGRLQEQAVRQMLGVVDKRYVSDAIAALADADGHAVVALVDTLRQQGVPAASLLEDMALLLQQMALFQSLGSLQQQELADESDAGVVLDLAGRLPPDETQLLYSFCLKGREELGLAPDEYSGLVMILLRLLAFKLPPGAITRSAAPAPGAQASMAAGAASGGQETKAQPSGQEAQAQPSGQEAPAQPSGQETKAQTSGQEAPAQPSGQETKAQPSGQEAKAQPSGQEAKAQPSGQEAKAQPSGKKVPVRARPVSGASAEALVATPVPSQRQPGEASVAAPAPAASRRADADTPAAVSPQRAAVPPAGTPYPPWEEGPAGDALPGALEQEAPQSGPETPAPAKAVRAKAMPAKTGAGQRKLPEDIPAEPESPQTAGRQEAGLQTEGAAVASERHDAPEALTSGAAAEVFAAPDALNFAALAASSQGWYELVSTLVARGRLTALVRELAMQSQPVAQQGEGLLLRVAGSTLLKEPLRVKLQAVLHEAGMAGQLQLEQGEAPESPAMLQQEKNEQAQQEAERIVENDARVQWLRQHLGAQVVPGSVRAIAREEDAGRN